MMDNLEDILKSDYTAPVNLECVFDDDGELVDMVRHPPKVVSTKGIVEITDDALYTRIERLTKRAVSPLVEGECQLWTLKYEATKGNRGYVTITLPHARPEYVYRILHRLQGGNAETKWLMNPRCHRKNCVNPAHWRKEDAGTGVMSGSQ